MTDKGKIGEIERKKPSNFFSTTSLAASHFSRGIERKTSAISLSNWVPAQRRISFLASSNDRGGQYDRPVVITSNASATEKILASRGIDAPWSLSGYPFPSILSWWQSAM